MTKHAETFRRTEERQAYALLHSEGLDALYDRHGSAVAADLINRWAEKGIARVKWHDGSMIVRTFKKYAGVK